MVQPDLRLFHYWRSSSSWRVRWALAHKGLAYEAVAINLLDGQQTSPAYLATNPAGFVPALQVGPLVLTESVAICEYLDEAFDGPALRPTGPADRARMRQLVEVINAGTQPLQNLHVLKKMGDTAAQRAWARAVIERGLGAFEATLARHDELAPRGRFCVGDAPTLADLFLVPQLYNARRFDVDLSVFPRCSSIEREAIATAAHHASHPDRFAPVAT